MRCLNCSNSLVLYCTDCGYQEKRYYNSDLNRWVGENLPIIFTFMDIDSLHVKMLVPTLNIIECKPPSGNFNKGQETALDILSSIFKFAMDNGFRYKNNKPWELGVYIAWGEHPFENGINMHNLITDKQEHWSMEKFSKFLKREIDDR